MSRTRILEGHRIGRGAPLRTGAATAVFDDARARILLTRRADNGEWCLPGGGIDPGESAAEAAERETREETGLEVRVGRLIGVYSSPHEIVAYPDGNRFQVVALLFEAEVVGGEAVVTDETTGWGWFDLAACEAMTGGGAGDGEGADVLLASHRRRIRDAFAFEGEAFVR